jgi:hypothetical protein
MIVEELHVDWSRVRVVFADPNRHLRNNNKYRIMARFRRLRGRRRDAADSRGSARRATFS